MKQFIGLASLDLSTPLMDAMGNGLKQLDEQMKAKQAEAQPTGGETQ